MRSTLSAPALTIHMKPLLLGLLLLPGVAGQEPCARPCGRAHSCGELNVSFPCDVLSGGLGCDCSGCCLTSLSPFTPPSPYHALQIEPRLLDCPWSAHAHVRAHCHGTGFRRHRARPQRSRRRRRLRRRHPPHLPSHRLGAPRPRASSGLRSTPRLIAPTHGRRRSGPASRRMPRTRWPSCCCRLRTRRRARCSRSSPTRWTASAIRLAPWWNRAARSSPRRTTATSCTLRAAAHRSSRSTWPAHTLPSSPSTTRVNSTGTPSR